MKRFMGFEGAATIYACDYVYDLVGNRVRIHEGTLEAGGGTYQTRDLYYTYDLRYQLMAEDWGDMRYQYSYDLAGNRKTMHENGVLTAYAYNSRNELVTATKGGVTRTYAYDANGNRISKSISGGGDVTDYRYDTSNRLVEADVNTATVFAAAYDYRTRRVSKRENGDEVTFRYDGGVSFEEIDAATGQTKVVFVRGSGMGGGIGSILYSDRTEGREYFVYNAVGHTVATVSEDGSVKSSNLYEAFGNVVSSTGTSDNNRLANTKERDFSIGLDNHGFRYYDTEIGRYTTRDPIGYEEGMHVYLYVHNNPVNFVDPLGLFGANWDKVHETITKRVAEDAVKGRRLKREWAKPFKRGLVSGSAWPDAPEGKYKGYKVVVRDKGTTGQGTLTWESHYGSKQYWHSMNPGGMSANEIKENILRQAGEWYDEAVELDRGKNPEGAGERIGRILHMVQDSHTESHTERDPKTGRIKEFKDYSKQDPEEHGKSDVPKEGNPESYRNLEKNLPGAKKAKEVSGQLVEAYLAKNKKRFMSVVEGNYELAEKGQSRKQKNEKDWQPGRSVLRLCPGLDFRRLRQVLSRTQGPSPDHEQPGNEAGMGAARQGHSG